MTSVFEQYKNSYEVRQANLWNKQNEDELTQCEYCVWDGSLEFVEFSGLAIALSDMDGKEIPKPERLLWVVTNDVRCAHEHSDSAKKFTRKYLSHTNITGGEKAYAGGQLAFLKPAESGMREIVLDGRSSRYMPRNREELKKVAEVFASTGYDVHSLGWDDEINEPSIKYRSNTVEIIRNPGE
jgi:hypothetical protein